jgi:DNA-binding transcriptional ArsR family regulator
MSPNTNTNTNIKWDPSYLRLKQSAEVGLPVSTRPGRRPKPVRGNFIAGPVDVAWVCEASHMGVKALLVGLALWHIRGLKKTDTFIVSNLRVGEWGIKPDAKSRALRALEKAGLVTIARRGKRSPQVTLVVRNTANEPNRSRNSLRPFKLARSPAPDPA